MMTFMGVVLVFVSMFSALCYYIIDPIRMMSGGVPIPYRFDDYIIAFLTPIAFFMGLKFMGVV